MNNEGRLNHEVISTLKSSRISTCFHPSKEDCSKDIINAHSLQNNGVLSLLSDNGLVVCIEPGVGIHGLKLNIKDQSKNKATTFRGFCKYHDTELFKPIETHEYNPNSLEQNYIFAYRVYAYEYYKKIVAMKTFQKMVRKIPSRLRNKEFIVFYRNYQLSLLDLEEYKNIFDKALLSKEFDRVYSYVIEFDYQLSFASCFGYSPLFDFNGNELNLLLMLSGNQERLKMNFVTILPQKDKSYLIYSWLKDDNEHFNRLGQQLESYSVTDIKKLFNNLLPEYTENMVFAPKLWNRFSDDIKSEIVKRIQGDFPKFDNNIMFMSDSLGRKIDMHERAPYNLFRRF